MLLAIDIGNSNVTIGLIRDGALVATRRAATHAGATTDELELQLDGLLRLDESGLADVSAICLASVVSDLTAGMEGLAARRRIPILVASAGTIPLAVRVDRPALAGRSPLG